MSWLCSLNKEPPTMFNKTNDPKLEMHHRNCVKMFHHWGFDFNTLFSTLAVNLHAPNQRPWLHKYVHHSLRYRRVIVFSHTSNDLSTARQKWRLDGPALLGHLLYSLVNHAYANRYHHHLVRQLVSSIIIDRYGFHVLHNQYSGKRCVNHEDQDRRAGCR